MNLNNINNRIIIGVIVVVVVIVLGGGGYYFYSQKPQSIKGAAAQEEVKKMVAEVGKLIELPTGEDPTVATVTDITKLKDQLFFQKAKNGDKVLIYTNAKKAILYNPTSKKILDVAPFNMGSSSAQVAQPKISIKNGTDTIGLTAKIEPQIKGSFPQINIVNKDNAVKNNYDKTIVVLLNDSFKDTATGLVNILKGSSVGDLPTGETKPKDTDILIILGKDRI